MFSDFSRGIIVSLAHHFWRYNTVIILVTWITALLGAGLTFLVRSDVPGPRSWRGFLAFCFPATILRERSCRLDLFFTIATRWTYPIAIAPVLIGSAFVAKGTHVALTSWFGSHPGHMESVSVQIAILAVSVVFADGFNFCAHVLDHKVKVLWEFHKVHHAATFLIPITNRRVHPVQEILDDTAVLFGVGLWLGAVSYVFWLPIQVNMAFGMDTYFLANLFSFYHLRHSHIPMSYGWLENIFLSPAQHQLHHSYEVRHWDRNFGLLLSCWDQLAGTFLRSEPANMISPGLPPQYRHQYNSLLQLYVTPLLNVGRMAGSASVRSLRRLRPDCRDKQAL